MIRSPSYDEDADDQQSDHQNDPAGQTSSLRADPELARRLAGFERLYRAEFGTVAGYFARRTTDPELVAELMSDTFVAAMRAYGSFRPERTSARAWTIGVARRVWARHRETAARWENHARRRASMGRLLSREEIEELLLRIDVENSAAELLARLAPLAESDREAIELIDLVGLSPGEAARVLGVSSGVLHVRLLLARARLRRQEAGA
jgi:RNA polymerase sigma-70 factor (ECF subfamily)